MSARAHRLRSTSVFYLLVICTAITPRSIVSPNDLEAPASHNAAQSLDSSRPGAIDSEESTVANNVDLHSHGIGAEVAHSLGSSSNVGAEAASEPLSGFASLDPSTSSVKPSIGLSSLSEASLDIHASALPGRQPGLAADGAPTLIGHVVSVSHSAGNQSGREAMPEIAAPEDKLEQPLQVSNFPFPACMSSLRYNMGYSA